MNPNRKACLDAAARIWRDQPTLGVFEAANEVRVLVRAARDPSLREVPGVEAIRRWLSEAIEAGEITGPQGPQGKPKSQRQRRKT